MTPIELVEDTIAYYADRSKRGASDGGTCNYRMPNGNMCAVGRWIDWNKENLEKNMLRKINDTGSISQYTETGADYLFLRSKLKPEVQHIPINLWIDLQNYHDLTIAETSERDVNVEEEKLREKWKNK